mgnify:CR=1 FL=1
MTNQFFKGLLMAVMTVVVAAFATQPVDYLLLAVTAVSTILVYTGKNLITLLHSESPAGSLSLINLVSGLLVAVGTGILESAALYIIEGHIAWDIVWKVVVSAAFTYLGTTFFSPQHSEAKVRGFISPATSRAIRKGIATMAVFIFVAAGVNAQGFIKDVTPERISKKYVYRTRSTDTLVYDGQQAWFLRGGLTVSYKKIFFDKDLNKVVAADYNRPGVGLEYARFEIVDGSAVSDMGVGGYLMIPVKDMQNYLSAMVSVQVYDLARKLKLEFLPPGLSVGGGLVYDFNKERPTLERFGFVPTLSIKF